MPDFIDDSPIERGEALMLGQCQVCGILGSILMVPSASPNQLCPRCAIEYGGGVSDDME